MLDRLHPAPSLHNAAPSPADAHPAAACLDPMVDATRRVTGAVEPETNPPDLDGDGHPDVVLRTRGG